MIQQVTTVAAMMLTTSATHVAGLWILEPVVARYRPGRGLPYHGVLLMGLAISLLALHTIEILEYAAAYQLLAGLKPEAAIYFSAAVYSTIGSSQVYLPDGWRLVGSFEGVNGMVLIGWSTAFLFAAWRDILHPGDV